MFIQNLEDINMNIFLNSNNLVNVLSPGKYRVYTEVLSALIGLQAIVQL